MKAEELLPKLLKDLSNGVAISIKEVAENHEISNDSIKVPLRSIRDNFYPKSFKYDGSSRKWVVEELGFLQKTLLKPEEAVVLNAILRNKSSQGKSLTSWNEKIVENYIKRTSSFIFKQHIAEEITEDMEQLFAQVHSAIDDKKEITFNFHKEQRTVYPYKIIYVEYYWYLLGYEKNREQTGKDTNKLKSYSITKIRRLEVGKEAFVYDFGDIENKLEHIMNAYFNLDTPAITVELLIEESFSKYIDRASFFSGWKKINYVETISEKQYIRYEVKTTDEEYRDIIPTVLQYMPNILVETPNELKEKLSNMIGCYQVLCR